MIELMVGIGGMVLILAAFVLEEFDGKFNQETIVYNLFNVVGSAMLIYYGLVIRGWPFVFLNGVWCLTALVKLGKISRKKNYRKFLGV